MILDSKPSCDEDCKEKDGDGEDGHLYSLAVVELNLLVLLFLKFHQDPPLFLKIVDGFIELMVNALGQTSHEGHPEFLSHSRQIA